MGVLQPELVASPNACRGWDGTVSGSTHQQSEGQTTDETWSAHVHFTTVAPVETAQLDGVAYASDPTTIAWGGLSGTVGDCTVSDPAQTIAVDGGDASLTIDQIAPSWSTLTPPPPVYGATASALDAVVAGTMDCPSDPPQDTFDTVLIAPWIATADPAAGLGPDQLRAFAGPTHLAGTVAFHPDGATDRTTTVTWDLGADADG